MDRNKLSKLIADKQSELGKNQAEFAKYFSQIANNPISYGWVQAMTNPKKESIPEWINMKGIAKLWNLSLDELDTYLEDDSITDVSEVSKVLRDKKEFLKLNSTMSWELIKDLPIEEQVALFKKIFENLIKELEKANELKNLLSSVKDKL
jgi:hypothetical protein